eukprot:NODE_595_length_1781_cov_278.876663_g585_i0.p1 GENE.NODE_595_length_1781_cov_278.876663_g585_i0~~NODE_595_length_1781_cov_278.876663_g585_i0.p1  ORF type:complete len:537 (+),score=113.86 NODE_595_length_1781_cov_278.876663_g585_i0:80-1690(+)
MFRLVACALVASVVAFAEETKHRSANPQVVQGEQFTTNTYHAGLVVGDIAPRYDTKTATLTCNGVFVERDWVLTSSSCLQGMSSKDMGVVFTVSSTNTLNVDTDSTPIWTVIRYVPYEDEQINLALVQIMPRAIKGERMFDPSVTRPDPVEIAEESPAEGDALQVSGYGCHREYPGNFTDDAPKPAVCTPNKVLRKGTATVRSKPVGAETGDITEPIDATKPGRVWTDNVMCYYDLGGPALNADGQLVGVFSGASKGCGDENGWSVFTDVTQYRDWIADHTSCSELQVITTSAERAMDTDVYACFQVEHSRNLPSELRLMFPDADWKLKDASVLALEGVEDKVEWSDKQGVLREEGYTTAVTTDEVQVRFPAPFVYSDGNFDRRVKLYLTGVVNPNNCEGGHYAATAWPCHTFNLMNAEPPVWVRRCGANPVSVQLQTASNSYSDEAPCLFCNRDMDGWPHNTPRGCSLCNSCKMMYTTTDGNKVYKCESNGLTIFRTDVPDGSNNPKENFCDPMSNGKGEFVPFNPYREHLAESG